MLRNPRLKRVSAAANKVLLVGSFMVITACDRRGESASGSVGSGASATGSDQTTTPNSAPDAQPHYREVGNGTTSRVITNAIGQKGYSVNETNGANASGQNPNDLALS